jgi:hypothetical protein
MRYKTTSKGTLPMTPEEEAELNAAAAQSENDRIAAEGKQKRHGVEKEVMDKMIIEAANEPGASDAVKEEAARLESSVTIIDATK